MKKKVTFEEAMEKMEGIVAKLEEGNLSLEESMALFQEGMELSKFCGDTLTNVESKIQALVKDGEGFALKDIEVEEK